MTLSPSRLLAGAGRVLPVAALVVALTAGSARADVISFTSDPGLEGLGHFTGSLTVNSLSSTAATITLSLTNTSPVGNSGYITGFAFNNPATVAGGNITGVTGYNPGAYTGFQAIGSAALANNTVPVKNDGIAANPLGTFDLGAAIGGKWLGGGKPQLAIAVNQTGTFTFNVTGTDLDHLTADSIVHAYSDSKGNATQNWLAVRFRGFANGGSDKVTAGGHSNPDDGGDDDGDPWEDDGGNGGPNSVPAPAGLVLGLLAAAGLGVRRKLIG